MNSLQQLVESSKSQFVTKHSITFIDQNIDTIGRSQSYQNMYINNDLLIRICLHLSRNQLRSLQGLEQFTFLRYLSVSHNLLQSSQDLIPVSANLSNLSVIANPLCLNPDYEAQLIEIFPELVQLDQLQLNKQKKVLAIEVRAKLESYMLLLLNFFGIQESLYGRSLQISQGIQELLLNKIRQPILIVFDGVIKLLTSFLTITDTNQQDILKTLFSQFQNPIYQQQFTQNVYDSIKDTMNHDFNDNSVNLYFAGIALKTCDLLQFSNDSDYMRTQILQSYLLTCQQKENLTSIPIFVFNQRYLYAVLEMVRSYAFKNKQQVKDLIDEKPSQIPTHSTKKYLTQNYVNHQQGEQLTHLNQNCDTLDQVIQGRENHNQRSPTNIKIDHSEQTVDEIINQHFSTTISRAKMEFKFLRAMLNIKKVTFSVFKRSLQENIKYQAITRKNYVQSGIIKIHNFSTKQHLKIKRQFIKLLKVIKLVQILKKILKLHSKQDLCQILLYLKRFIQTEKLQIHKYKKHQIFNKVLKAIKHVKRAKQKALQLKKLNQKIMGMNRLTFLQIWKYSNEIKIFNIRQSYDKMNNVIAIRSETLTKFQQPPKYKGFLQGQAVQKFMSSIQYHESEQQQRDEFTSKILGSGKKICSVCSYSQD